MSVKSYRAFTLVEILIVVVLLGVLSAIVVPQFTSATDEAQKTATKDQLVKLREAIDLYHVRNGAQYPVISAGAGNAAWGGLIGPEYLRQPGINSWVGGTAGLTVVLGNQADAGYQQDHGWIWDPVSHVLRAGSYDDNDDPFPKQ